MNLPDLRDRIIDAEILTEANGLLADIMAGFDALKDKANKTENEIALFTDLATAIAEHGFCGRQMEAINILKRRIN